MGGVSRYQVNVPSNQIHIIRRDNSNYSSATLKEFNDQLDPWFLTGFTDAEGSFGLYIRKTHDSNTGWAIRLTYSISLLRLRCAAAQRQKDRNVLQMIQNYLGCGKIYDTHGPTTSKYQVNSINDLKLIIAHFSRKRISTP